MATRTRTYRVCNGCGASELDGAVIVKSKPEYPFYEAGMPTVDMCQDCEENEMYICNLCHQVHDDAHPCEMQLRDVEPIDRVDHAMTDDEIPF